MTEGKRNIIRQFFEEYDIESAEDTQDALKELLSGTIRNWGTGIWGVEHYVREPASGIKKEVCKGGGNSRPLLAYLTYSYPYQSP